MTRRTWTAAEREYLSANYATCHVRTLAAELGRSPRAVWTQAHRMELSRHPDPPVPHDLVSLLRIAAEAPYGSPLMLAACDAAMDLGWDNQWDAAIAARERREAEEVERELNERLPVAVVTTRDFYRGRMAG